VVTVITTSRFYAVLSSTRKLVMITRARAAGGARKGRGMGSADAWDIEEEREELRIEER